MKTLLVQDGSKGPVLRQALQERGWEVSHCGSSDEARATYSRERRPLVVIDLLEDADAERFGAWLKKQPLAARTFVLLIISSEQAADVPRLLETCGDEVLTRPYEPAGLQIRLAAVERHIRLRQQWQQKEDLLSSRAQQQVAIAALGQAALSEDLATLFDLAGKMIIYSIEVEFFSILELTEDSQALKFVAGFGWAPGWIAQNLPLPVPGSLTARTLAGEDCFAEDVAGEKQFEPRDFVTEHGIRAALSVAIKSNERGVFGVLGAYTSQARRINEDELRFLEGLANVLGATMERHRINAEIQRHQGQVQHLQRLESVGQLAAGLAHDYNNVLTIIHGHVTLALGDSTLPARLSTSLKAVLDAVERAASLTRQMLSFSRKQAMQPAPVDLNAVIQGLVKLLDRVLGRNIRLETALAPDLPAIRADAGMLDQVLMNLAVNARDAMPKGGRLVIATEVTQVHTPQHKRHPDASEGEFVCVRVTDTGCGMDAATMRRIFDPFFTTKEPGKGTGLGLSTVYGIVKQHEGWVEVESEVGKGTSFRIFFPSLGKPVERPISSAERPAHAESGAQGAQILLVEDEPTLRDLAKLLLEEAGHRVLEAGAGSEALRLWEENKGGIGVLLTDVVLPDGLTGFDLAERFHRENPNLRVIVTSGYSAEKVRSELPAERAFQFLQKPYRAEALARAIREALKPL